MLSNQTKLASLYNCLDTKNAKALLTINPCNIRYFTDLTEISGALLIEKKRHLLLTNAIYRVPAKNKKGNFRTKIIGGRFVPGVVRELKRRKLKSIILDISGLDVVIYRNLRKILKQEGVKVIEDSQTISNLRSQKTPDEINRIKQATNITLQTIKYAQTLIDSKITEKVLAAELVKFIKIFGDSKIAFDPVVAFGRNSACAHHVPGNIKRLNKKVVLLDLGAKYQGYCADLTRVFFSDKMPSHLREIHEIVAQAAKLAIKKIKPGIKACAVDRVARDYIKNKGFGRYFGHGLGHGVGLCVHERPYLNPYNQDKIKPGQVITIEPAIYITGKYGIRLEEMVLVGDKKAEVLSGDINI
jgi:Xaa-Pro aminopeptidase